MIQKQQIDSEESFNNIVAQSDYDAALAAIESTFDSFQMSSRRYGNEEHSLDYELIDEIYKTAKASLLTNVKRIVRPINDNDYSDYVDQYHVILDEESDTDLSSDQDTSLIDDESDNEDEEDIDEEELIDTKALKDAQELRMRIRSMSRNVQTVRERVLKLTKDSVLSATSAHLIDRPVEFSFNNKGENGNDKGRDGDSSNDKENIVEDHFQCKDKFDASNIESSDLQNSLTDLSRVLRDPQWKHLPNRIQSLQQTIETVQKETAKDRVMSKTEIAITSRYNDLIDESSRRKILGEGLEENGLLSENHNASAMDRLALFSQIFS